MPGANGSPASGFEFDYPNGWTLESLDDNSAAPGVLIGNIENQDDTRILITYQSRPRLSLADVLALSAPSDESSGLVSSGVTEFTLGERPAGRMKGGRPTIPSL